jgi:sugar/nucleoside kinase (ribokinase family)
MGINCTFIGKLGDDQNGGHYKAMFNKIGVGCSRFKTDGSQSTACWVSLDLCSFEVVEASRNFLSRILWDYVDIVFANEEEAVAYAGHRNPKNNLDVLGQHCQAAAVKMGEDGAWLKNGSETVVVPVIFTDRLFDTIGAGDFWAAGFLFGHLNGYSLLKSGVVASLLGRHVIEHRRTVLPKKTWDRIILDTIIILNKKENELC